MWPGTLPYLGVGARSLIWFFALAVMVIWTRTRAVRRYGMRRKHIERIVRWGVLADIFGAWAGAILDRLPQIAQGLIAFDPRGYGFSSGPGHFAFVAAVLFVCRKNPRDVTLAMEAASVPTAFMLAIGRLGCLAGGCCRGLPTTLPIGIHFPDMPPDTAVFPIQPLESAVAVALGFMLMALEKKRGTCVERQGGALLMPLLIVCFGAWRVLSGFLRADARVLPGLIAPQLWWIAGTLVGALWLTHTLLHERRVSPLH